MSDEAIPTDSRIANAIKKQLAQAFAQAILRSPEMTADG